MTVLLAFGGSFCLGVTAVFLKRAHVDNGLYGLVVRSLGSVPLVIILTLIFAGPTIFSEVRSSFVSIFLTIAALSLILADILIMDILKRKPVGLIVPLIALFPLFTTLLLIITDQVVYNPPILYLTLLIVFGVILVTYDPDQVARLLDWEALAFGLAIALLLGITNYADVVVIQNSNLVGLGYTSLKFGLLLVFSLIIFSASGGLSQATSFMANRSSTNYLLLAGFTAWGLGSYFIYTAYAITDPQVVNAIIGVNPIFAVILSLFLGMEEFKPLKLLGLLICTISAIGIVNL